MALRTALEDRRERPVLERIAFRIAATPEEIDEAWWEGSRAGSEAQLAGESVALGLYFVRMVAETATGGKPKRVYRAMTPESGEAAARFLAHALARIISAAHNRPSVDRARGALESHFPLDESQGTALHDLIADATDQDGFYAPEAYPGFSLAALGMVIGPDADSLPCFKPGDDADEYERSLLWNIAWGKGNQMFFKLVDPRGYDQWERTRSTDEE